MRFAENAPVKDTFLGDALDSTVEDTMDTVGGHGPPTLLPEHACTHD